MRHLIGIAQAVVMAGVLFFAGTWGYLRAAAVAGHSSVLPAGGGSLLADRSALAPLIAVAATGLLAGILIGVPRISPFAAGLPGLLLLGMTALYLTSVRRGVAVIPLRSHAFGAGLEAMLSRGILGAAGLAMIIPFFVPSRWRAPRRAAAPAVTEASEFVSSLTKGTGPQEPAQPADQPTPLSRGPVAGYAPASAEHGPPPVSGRRPYVTQ